MVDFYLWALTVVLSLIWHDYEQDFHGNVSVMEALFFGWASTLSGASTGSAVCRRPVRSPGYSGSTPNAFPKEPNGASTARVRQLDFRLYSRCLVVRDGFRRTDDRRPLQLHWGST